MMTDPRRCFLGKVEMCRGAKDQQFQKDVTVDRISKIKEASIRRQDGLDQHLNLESFADIQIHRVCVSTYTSEQHVSRIEKKRRSMELEESREAKQLRSDDPVSADGEKFDFDKQSILNVFRGKDANLLIKLELINLRIARTKKNMFIWCVARGVISWGR